MTFFSLADASRCLGIDAKTLRRWLTEGKLPLLAHPVDGRKKGVSRQHLERLAHLHQRRLAPLPGEPPVPVPGQGPELPTALLALPERLDTLQTQITALQQQVTDLTGLLTQPQHEPSIAAAQAKPGQRSQRFAKPASPAASAKTPAKPVHVIPRVEYGASGRYVVICPKKGWLPFEPDTEAWFAWVAKQDSFRFAGKSGHFTAHHEWRVPKGAWRAHRHLRNHSSTLRLAPNQELTIAVLEQAALALQAQLA